MAGLDSLGTVFGVSSFLSGVQLIIFGVVLLFFVVALAVVSFFAWRWYEKKSLYNLKIHIYYQEKGTRAPRFKEDRGGVFTNKRTNIKRLYLYKARVGLNPDTIPTIFSDGGKKIITLWQTSIKGYRYVTPAVYDNPGLAFHVGEEDVNWALVTFNEWVNRFKVSSFIERYGHMILWAVTIMGTLFLVFFVMQKFDVLSSVATNLNAAAEALRDTSLGTVVE